MNEVPRRTLLRAENLEFMVEYHPLPRSGGVDFHTGGSSNLVSVTVSRTEETRAVASRSTWGTFANKTSVQVRSNCLVFVFLTPGILDKRGGPVAATARMTRQAGGSAASAMRLER
jgi:hypothetical protein